MGLTFNRAERRKLKVKIGLTGPSGSGKSYTALRLAAGLATGVAGKKGRVAMINTERNRGELYSTEFAYDILELAPPYSPERYCEAIDTAVAEGYDVLIVDSASHEWIGSGGVLDLNSKMGGNSWANWRFLTPRHDAFIDKIVGSDVHLICTLRGKDEYVQETNEQGKVVPKKVGMGAQQRNGVEYEFHLTFNLNMDHVAVPEKDNTRMFDGRLKVLTEEDGAAILEWATSGKDSPVSALRRKLRDLTLGNQDRLSDQQREWLAGVLAGGGEGALQTALEKLSGFLAGQEKVAEQKGA